MAEPLYLNNLATANYGFAQGQQQQASRLAGQAFAAPPDQRQGALNQLAGVDVNAATKMQSNFQTRDDADLKKFGNAIDYMGNALKSGNQQQIQGAFQAVRPYLAEKAQAAGKDPSQLPQQWDDSMLPAFYQAQAQVGHAISGGTAESQNFANMTQGFSPEDIQKARRINVGLDPRAAQPTDPHIVTINTPQGEQQYYQTPQGLAPLKLAGQGSPAVGQPSQGLPAGAASTYAPSLPASLTDAVQHQESGGNPNAVSSAGAQGLMQLMPQTAANPGFGVQPTQDGSPQENQRVGQQYLAALTQKYGGNTQLALAAYNAGPGRMDAAMQQAGGDPTKALTLLPPETQNYVPSVMGQAGGGLGFKPKSAASSDVIGNRSTQFDQLVSQGAVDPKSPDFQSQRNTYLATGKMGSDFQGGGSIAPIGDYTKSGAEYLATVPPAEQGVMNSLLNGTAPMPTGSALKSPLWQSMMAGAVHADPSWNVGAYKQYADTRKFFTTGKGGTTISNISTAMAHADEMLDTVKALDNNSLRPLAAGENYTSALFGKTPVTNFGSVLTALSSEMASVYKNGNSPTDQETNHWREQLSVNMSKEQQTDVLRHWVDLLKGKMNSVQQQYRSGMSNMADPLTVISPDARAAMSRINAFSDKLNGNTGSNPQINDAPIYAPGQQAPQQRIQPQQPQQPGQPPASGDFSHLWGG